MQETLPTPFGHMARSLHNKPCRAPPFVPQMSLDRMFGNDSKAGRCRELPRKRGCPHRAQEDLPRKRGTWALLTVPLRLPQRRRRRLLQHGGPTSILSLQHIGHQSKLQGLVRPPSTTPSRGRACGFQAVQTLPPRAPRWPRKRDLDRSLLHLQSRRPLTTALHGLEFRTHHCRHRLRSRRLCRRLLQDRRPRQYPSKQCPLRCLLTTTTPFSV